MREHNKRWLMSRMRTSGSQRTRVQSGDYADGRNEKRDFDFEDLPQKEAMRESRKFYNGKIDFGPLVRFLRGQAGRNWDDVYSEILERIPTDLLDYRSAIFWFVADKVDIIDGVVWNRASQRVLWTSGIWNYDVEYMEFYVDPVTGILVRLPDPPSRHASKKLSGTDLKKFRAREKEERRARRGFKRIRKTESNRAAGEILKEDNRKRQAGLPRNGFSH